MLRRVTPVRAELRVVSRWVSREYTTLPTRYVPFTVWSLVFDISCELPIRFAHLLRSGGDLRWGLADGGGRVTSRSPHVTFHPTDWLGSDEVHVSFGSSLSVTDEELPAPRCVELRAVDRRAAPDDSDPDLTVA